MKKIPKKLLSGQPNFIATNRRLTTVRRHIPVVLKPLIVALLGVALWKFVFYDSGITFGKESENPILFLILPLVSFVYVIFASIAVGSVFDEYKKLSQAVVQKDLDTFLTHRDEQLPILIHILIGVPSIILVVLSLLFHYENLYIGMSAIFAVFYVVASTWMVVTELDNFRNSIWFKHKVPTDWYEIDVEEYFKAK